MIEPSVWPPTTVVGGPPDDARFSQVDDIASKNADTAQQLLQCDQPSWRQFLTHATGAVRLLVEHHLKSHAFQRVRRVEPRLQVETRRLSQGVSNSRVPRVW